MPAFPSSAVGQDRQVPLPEVYHFNLFVIPLAEKKLEIRERKKKVF